METKINLNTIILLLVLLVFVVGTIVALVSIRRLTQPLEEAGQAFEQKLDQLTQPQPIGDSFIHRRESHHR